jgi:hypothetical protein|tara:strand:+ start:494 stop:625 length:132 start_codon:yes stop_codon:yes gene_type:complete
MPPLLLLFMALLSVYAGILIVREILRAKWRMYDDSNNKSSDRK